MNSVNRGIIIFIAVFAGLAVASGQPPLNANREFEATFESGKAYADPFNDVDLDVIFSRGGQSWRVPTFWRGGS